MITSEWGTPNMFENGANPEFLLTGKYGHQLHVWDLRRRRHRQTIDLGPEQQMVLELRPAYDPGKAHGFAGVVKSLKDLSASVWRVHDGHLHLWLCDSIVRSLTREVVEGVDTAAEILDLGREYGAPITYRSFADKLPQSIDVLLFAERVLVDDPIGCGIQTVGNFPH